jgi:sec-independent protein translocase protein TatA
MPGLDNPLHLAFLLVLVLVVFGAKRLPEMGRSLGHGMRGFKDALSAEQPATAVTLAAASAESAALTAPADGAAAARPAGAATAAGEQAAA